MLQTSLTEELFEKNKQKRPSRLLQEALRGGSPAEGQGDEGGLAGAGKNVIELLLMEDGGGPAWCCGPPATGAGVNLPAAEWGSTLSGYQLLFGPA